LKKEKQDLINQQKLVTLTKIDVPQNQVMETKLVEIQKEIQKLSVSLPAISRVLNQVEQDVKHIPDKITIQVPVVSVPVPAPIEVPVPVQMPVPVAVETPPPAPIPQAQPAPPVEPIPIPLSLPNPPIPHPAPQEPITTSPEDPSTRSIFSLTDQVKSEDIPSLELLLKRILKKPSKDRIDQLQKDIEKVKHVGTSPPSSHIARDLEKRYKKSKKGETSRISWICPGCITDSSQSISIPKQSKMMLNNINELKPKDSSMLFANDTSMIHPLAQIVAELENEQNEMDLDDLEVLSSLNGF
jgi:hypothetical protein